MRAAFLPLLIAGAAFAQVQNAADVGVSGSGSTTVLAPGARAVVSYVLAAGNSAPGSPSVSLLPVNSTTPFPAQVLSQGSSAITFVVPPDMPLGPAQLIYKPAGQATQWTSITIVPASLSLYRTGPVGPLIAPIINLEGSGVASGLAQPAQPGFGVEIFGSGLGATPQTQVQVTLGGVPQQVTYVGSPSYMAGVNQIDFIVAPGTPDGCYVPLVVTYGNQSVSSFLSKTSDGMPCHHPWGLSVPTLRSLDNAGVLNVGEIQLNTGIVAAASDRASRQESAQVIQTAMDAGQIASYFAGSSGSPAPSCSAVSPTGVIVFSVLGGSGLGAGQLTTASGTVPLPYTGMQAADSPLSALPAPLLAGALLYTTGGSAAFPFTLPPPIQLSGGAPLAINHTQNATIAWNGSGYDAFATLQLTLASQASALPAVSCTVPAQSGSVTIPASLLTSFAAGATGVLSVAVSESGPGIPADFVDNTELLALWSSTDARPVDFQ